MSMSPHGIVLVVDGSSAIREVLQELLADEGYAVETVPTGHAALDRVAAGGVAVIVLDLLLPDMSGLELCEILRQRFVVRVPIIILTVVASEGQRQAGFRAGADAYLTKPFEIPDFLEKLEACSAAAMATTAN